MANENKVETPKIKETVSTVKTPKAEKVKKEKVKKEAKPTSVQFLRQAAGKVHKSRKDTAVYALALMTKAGVTKNARGHTVTEENLLSLLNAMCRDIESEKGKAKIPGGHAGWWSTVKIIECTEEGKETFQIVAK